MSKIELLKVLTGGILNTNFFNGRVLTADDLKTEQDANRKQRERLGKAIGDGIIYGLEVSVDKDKQTLSVTPGLALNRLGQALCVPEEVLSDSKLKITLVPEIESVKIASKPFFDCPKSKDNVLSSTGEGIYLLVMSPDPAPSYSGKAPMIGQSDDSGIVSCGKQYVVEVIQFGLVRLDISNDIISGGMRNELLALLEKRDPENLSKLQNMLAHLCFGTEKIAGFAENPINWKSGIFPYMISGPQDTLHSSNISILNDSEVPLALVFWRSNKIVLIDMWSVRRRPVASSTAELWPLPLCCRRLAEAEACFQQFQEQIGKIYSSGNLNTLAGIEAGRYFRYLPPAGVIPVSTSYLCKYLGIAENKISVQKGFNPENFFTNMSFRKPAVIEGRKLGAIINSSLQYPPIDLRSKELIWLYLVRENVESIVKGVSNTLQPYLIFTSGHIQYHGDSRYDLSRWDYSNYSS